MNYSKLLLMALLSFISMYILMYMMVDKLANVYPNLNQFYMAGLMTAPMVLIELFVMRSMYDNRKINIAIGIASLAALILCIIFIKQQTAISDKEFLKSMIPHHAAALLMCKKASLQNPEIKTLCQNIIATQESEIKLMKEKLAALETNS